MLARGAPNKRGLDYFPKMINFYEDDKIFDLMDEYGPLGVTVYDVILTIVYEQGYYAELSKSKLSRMVIRKIGNKWIKNQRAVVQVIDYCADLGLLDKALLAQNVITSEGIQRRYHKIAVKLMKRQLYSDRYWLLEKEEKTEPVLIAPKNRIPSEENRITSEINRISSEKSQLKENEKKREIYSAPEAHPFSDPELEQAFQLFVTCRRNNGDTLSDDRILALREELLGLSDNAAERLAIVRKSVASGWKSFYPVSRKKNDNGKKNGAPRRTRFNNFGQRDYDYSELERQLLSSGRKDDGNEQTKDL